MELRADILRCLEAEDNESKSRPVLGYLLYTQRMGSSIYKITVAFQEGSGLKGKVTDYQIRVDDYPGILILEAGKESNQFIVKDVTGVFIGKVKSLITFWKSTYSITSLLDEISIPTRYHSSTLFFKHQTTIANHHFTESHLESLNFDQMKAIQQLNLSWGGIWGPPGTGKSHTFAKMIDVDFQLNRKKILVLSLSNEAIDVVLLKLLESNPHVSNIIRYGRSVNLEKFSGHENFLRLNPSEVSKINYLKERSDIDYEGYYDYKKSIQNKYYNQSKRDLIVGEFDIVFMTTMSALWNLATLVSQRFDAVYFDEASQIPKLHFYTLSTLAQRVYFAGDPNQLSPVVQQDASYYSSFLSESPFQALGINSEVDQRVVFLSEQFRMHEDICSRISDVFYHGKLKTIQFADPALNIKWHNERDFHSIQSNKSLDGILAPGVNLVPVSDPATRYQMGAIRHQSAELIIEMVRVLRTKFGTNEISVITPVHSQNQLIRETLQRHGLHEIHVSTAHVAQGKENDVIIFDPVDYNIPLNQGPEGRRLINVALTRTKTCLIVVCSEEDAKNIECLGNIICCGSELHSNQELRFIHVCRTKAGAEFFSGSEDFAEVYTAQGTVRELVHSQIVSERTIDLTTCSPDELTKIEKVRIQLETKVKAQMYSSNRSERIRAIFAKKRAA